MNILQLSKYYPPTYGGVEIVAEFFSRAANDLGHNVSVFSFGNLNSTYIGKYNESVHQFKENIKLKSAPISIDLIKNFKSYIKENKIELILVHFPNPFMHEVIKIFKEEIKSSSIKVYGIYHSDIINQGLIKDAYNFYFERDIKLYDGFICSSKNLINSSEVLSKLSLNKVKVLPFCIENNFNFKRQSSTEIKFLGLGRMVPYKGFEFLINVFNQLPYKLTLVGGGPLCHNLKKIAGPNIEFLGEVSEEEKYKLFSSHTALIVSSINRAEAYGMTIVEAFSAQIPVIASNIDTGVTFLVKNNETGLTFNILDKKDLQDKINYFLNSNQSEFSSTAKQFFDSTLSFPAFKNNFKEILNSI